jgi:hypothetical protein
LCNNASLQALEPNRDKFSLEVSFSASPNEGLMRKADMIRCVCLILLGMSGFLTQETQSPSNKGDSPSVSLLLPPNNPSETVQISYFLIGPFGGYGSHTKPTPGLQSYEIPGSVEGKTASEIRMIVYAAGCEIKTFVLPLSEASRVNFLLLSAAYRLAPPVSVLKASAQTIQIKLFISNLPGTMARYAPTRSFLFSTGRRGKCISKHLQGEYFRVSPSGLTPSEPVAMRYVNTTSTRESTYRHKVGIYDELLLKD